MENEWSFEELKKKAIEEIDKRYEDYFVKSHEMLMRQRKRCRQFKIEENLSEKLARMETNPLIEEVDPFYYALSKGYSDMALKEMEQIDYILRHWIDDPIKGEITKESLRKRCIRTILYKEPYEMDSNLDLTSNELTFTMTSGLLGVVQGDYLIGTNGDRSLLTEEQNRRLLEMGV